MQKIAKEEVKDPPYLELLFLFVNYGGWLLVFLTLLCWYWSGLALLGAIYLLFISPFVSLFIGIRLHFRRDLSSFHNSITLANICYVFLVGFLFIVFLLGQKS